MSEELNEENGIEPVYIEDEMKASYLDYAMSVIVGRALPDARDGLKPVHRRILHAMGENNWRYDRPYVKSAKVVGEVIANYHPHGDSAVYDTMVRMAQDFSMRYVLVDGQGNFGSMDGDPAAAYRYTEARLGRIAGELLLDIEKETVDFVPNFDGSRKEPVVLPARLPHLLLNGSSGIAVGMATNIPPHNLAELADAITLLIDEPEADLDEIMKIMPGPDFPTGGIIYGREGIIDAYRTGRGRISIGAVTSTEEIRGGREAIVIRELPYQVNKASLIEKIADLVRDKKIEGISDIRDESSRDGMRVVIELKKDADPDVVLNVLRRRTALLDTFGVIMLALVEGRPEILPLRDVLECFIRHRKEVIRRRSEFLLAKAEAEAHIKEGLIKAIGIIDEIIKTIRKSKDRSEAHAKLVGKYKFTDEQAKAILDLRLHRLTALEITTLRAELADLLKEIERLKFILAYEKEVLRIIKDDLAELKKLYGDERRTRIMDGKPTEISPEDLVKNEEVVITISHKGYIKRLPLGGYRTQRRGGRGVIGASTREEDFVEHIFTASTHDYILLFTESGLCHWLKVYDIPQGTRAAKGRPVVNLVKIGRNDGIKAFVPVSSFDDDRYIFMATARGKVKKTALSAYSRPRSTGIRAYGLDKGDSLIEARITGEGDDIVLSTRNGMAIRFSEGDVRAMGRTAGGVKGISLSKGDEVVSMIVVSEDADILTVCMKGYGKRTPCSSYRRQTRGGKGLIDIKTTERNGKVAVVREVSEEDHIIIATQKGVVIRCPIEGIKRIGRNTQGVRLIRLDEGDEVSDVTVLEAGS